MWRGRWSIRAWLGSLVAAVVLPLLLLLTGLFLWQLDRELKEARDQSRRLAKMTADRIRLQYRSSAALLARMAQRPAIREFDGAACDSLFAIAGFFPNWSDLLFYDRSGALVCSASPHGANETLSREVRPRIAAELARGVIPAGRPVVRFVQGRWLSILSQPVRSESGAARGTLVLAEWLDFVAGDAPVPDVIVTILDGRGNVIARTNAAPAMLGANVRSSEVAKIALREREGSTAAIGIDGVSRQYGFTFLPELGWTIFAGVRTAEVMQTVRTMVVIGAAGAAAITLLISVIAIVMSRGIQRPVHALMHATENAARTGYGRAEALDGPLEIARLAAAFNAMVAQRSESEQHLKAMSERLLLVQEQERMRVARELHDDLGQSLTALKMDVIGLLEKSRHSPDAAPMVARILRTIDSTVTAVQRISSELRPSALDDLGLFAALESEARLFEERTGIECDLSLPDDLPGIDEAVTVAVYRMIQEAMTNVARHSNASRVEIRVRRRAAELLLEIRDDGRGIGSDEIAARSAHGVNGIRERAALLGGAALIEGVADRGTIVSVRIPLPAQENEA